METKKQPKLGRAKRRNRVVGRVVLSGEDHYTKADWGPGESPSPECLREYLSFLDAWEARGRVSRRQATTSPTAPSSSILEAYSAYFQSVKRYEAAGRETSTWKFLRSAFASFDESFGSVPISLLTKRHLLTYQESQEQLVAEGKFLPSYVNRRLSLLRAWVCWANGLDYVADNLVTAVLTLRKVSSHHHRETIDARKRAKRAVSREDVERVAEHLPWPLRQMLRIHRRIGCRPGELCGMTWDQLRQVDDLWFTWEPKDHKTAHRGQKLVYWLEQSTVSMIPYGIGKVFGDVTPESYRAAIEAACVKAGVPRFTPHEIRHAVATERANDPRIPLAAAGRSLGHKRLTSLQPYVHDDDSQIREASRY